MVTTNITPRIMKRKRNINMMTTANTKGGIKTKRINIMINKM